LYPNRLTIIGYTVGGGGLAIISNSITALERLWRSSAIVKIMRPRVKLDFIFLYISIYETKTQAAGQYYRR